MLRPVSHDHLTTGDKIHTPLQSATHQSTTIKPLELNAVEYFTDWDDLDKDAKLENFEKALYRLKGGFGASKRGGPRAFYAAIDEVRDHFVNGTSMECNQQTGLINNQVGDYVDATAFWVKESEKS